MVDSLMATIFLFTGNFAPKGLAFCEGQLVNISNYQALFTLLGTTYGGNGTTTFALPDLREAEKSLGGPRYIIALQGIYPSRS